MTIKYHKNGLWVEKMSDSSYRLGLSEKGQDDVGEVMFAELSVSKGQVKKGTALLNVEGAKAVTEMTIPFDANITAVHEAVEDTPDLLNDADKEANWLVEVTDVSSADWNQLDDEMGPLEKDTEE